MSKQHLYTTQIVITNLQQGLLGNKCGSYNFIRGFFKVIWRLCLDFSLSTALVPFLPLLSLCPLLSPSQLTLHSAWKPHLQQEPEPQEGAVL